MMEPNQREGERKQDPISTIPHTDLRSYLVTALIIIGVVALGLLAVNQFMDFRFKAQFLGSPCDLCQELNPHLERCFEEASNVVVDQRTGEVVENPFVINIENLELE